MYRLVVVVPSPHSFLWSLNQPEKSDKVRLFSEMFSLQICFFLSISLSPCMILFSCGSVWLFCCHLHHKMLLRSSWIPVAKISLAWCPASRKHQFVYQKTNVMRLLSSRPLTHMPLSFSYSVSPVLFNKRKPRKFWERFYIQEVRCRRNVNRLTHHFFQIWVCYLI